MAQHRAIGLVQDSRRHVNHQVGIDADEMAIECRMVEFAEREAVRNDWLAARVPVGQECVLASGRYKANGASIAMGASPIRAEDTSIISCRGHAIRMTDWTIWSSPIRRATDSRATRSPLLSTSFGGGGDSSRVRQRERSSAIWRSRRSGYASRTERRASHEVSTFDCRATPVCGCVGRTSSPRTLAHWW